MSIIVGGHGIGLLDGSLGLLNRNDQTSKGTLGAGVESYVNVANGNLLLQERDVFLPSRGIDFALVRSYNSRGAIQGSQDGWWWSSGVQLQRHNDTLTNDNNISNYTVTYGDGSQLHFDFDAARNLWFSTDGNGAYETLQEVPGNGTVKYIVTRADQSKYSFDRNFVLLSIADANGVTTTFTYQSGRIQTVADDTGHQLVYTYQGNSLVSVVDRHPNQADVVLVRYTYVDSKLTQVTDRFGHVTTYTYDINGLLVKASLPSRQTVNGQVETFETREVQFTYEQVAWNDNPHLNTPFDSGAEWILKSMTDPLGGVTTFDYNFLFNTISLQPGDRDLNYKQSGGRFFSGGTTRIVDAMGNGLATSNTADFQAKRVSLGFAADVNALTQAQKDALRQQFSASYTYDPDGYLTRVVDQQGLATVYTYGGKAAGDVQTAVNQDNLLSVTDRNGSGATTSDSAYFRAVRQDLGFVDAAGNGKLVSQLTDAEKGQLLERFTTRFTYDAYGNLLTSTDPQGNQASYTYTAFNKVATATSAMGNALATSDDAQYQSKRGGLGFVDAASNGKLVSQLSDAEKTALRTLYTTTYAYDAKQNLVSRTDPGGDVTQFEYDGFGNLTKRTVQYRDADNNAVAAKNQVTTYAYDALGNNTSVVDAEGATITKTYDHFGNLLTSTDGRGGMTVNTYDADNRLLTQTDPEGHVTINRYDAVGNRISVTDAAGKTITHVFDRNNLLIATIDPSLADPAATRRTSFKYDVLGNRTEVTDAEGRKTVYSYDARRQLVDVRTPEVLQADGSLTSHTTTYAYDGESRIVTSTDSNGFLTQSLYTATGLLKRSTDGVGNVTEYLYDANLQQVQITVGAQLASALRRVLKFSYDEENQLVAQTDALGFVTRNAIDAPGNVAAVTDANGNRTQFEYDRNNRLVKETRPLLPGQATPYTVLHRFDANGNEIETTDENGKVTRYVFDKDNNVVMVSDPNGIETVFIYDSRHNQTSIAIGVQAQLDAAGRPVISDASQGQITSFVYDEFNQIVSSTDGVGNALANSDASVYQQLRTELGFAALVSDLSAVDRTALLNRFTERFAYDRVGNLVRSVDNLGRITALEYDALNRLQKRTEAQGTPLQRVTSLRYDGNGNVVKSTDALGRDTVSTYDAANRLTNVTDPLGVATRIEYDNVGNIIASTEAFGSAAARRTEYIYDLDDRLTRERDPGGHELAYEYDAVGNRLKVTDARGGATQYVYDALNRNVRIIDPLSLETRYEYDGVGNRIRLTDPRGGITVFEYDPGNRLVKTTDAEGRVTQLAYDPLGNVVTQTTAAGTALAEVTRFVYDAEGNLRSSTDAEGKTETRGYDAVYNYIRTTDRNGNETTYGFDALNRQIRITDPLGGQTLYTYDAADNRLTETGPLGRKRSFQYDADDRVIKETDALGVETHYAYNELDKQISVTRAANTAQAAVTRFVYNGDDQLVQQIDALGETTDFEYDANHNVTSIVDANSHATTYEYDANNQLTSIVDPLGNATQFLYDGNGNRVQVIDAKGNAATSYYNLDNEVVLTVDAKGFASSRRYDANGNAVSETLFMTPVALPVDPAVAPAPTAGPRDQTSSFEYDKLNRLVRSTDAMGGTTQISYDAMGNRLSETDENNRTTRYEYDANDRQVRIIDAKGGTTTSTFDAVGNRLSETDANGHTTTNAYDVMNRLDSSSNALGDTTRFTYDAVGNQLTQTDALGRVLSSVYDLADRLVERTDELGIKTRLDYDAVGNVLHETRAAGTANEATTTFTYDANNRVDSEADGLNQVTTYGYDANGNLVTETEPDGQVTTTTYDALDRIEKVTDAQGGTVTMGYDGAGNTVSETDANNRTRVDYYDRNNRLILTIDPQGFAESNTYDAAGNLLGNTRHVQKVALPVSPDALPDVTTDTADKTTRYSYDELDNIGTITDGEGYVTSFAYDAVGNQTESRQQVDKTDPSSDEIKHQYFDELDRLIGTLTGEGHLSTVQYDKVGNATERTDHDKTYTAPANGNAPTPDTDDPGRKVDAKYDEKGRIIEEKDSSGKVKTHEYDERGNETKTVEAVGTEEERVKETKYDKADRVVESVDALGIITRYVYDRNGNVVELIEAADRPDQRTTLYTYNNRNQLISQTDALGHINEYTYDAFGNKVEQTLAKGTPEERTESFEYDGNNQLVAQVNGEGERTRFEYDGAGNQTRIIVGEGPEQRIRSTEYDRDHQVIAEVDGNGVRTEYRYDGQGNRTDVFQAVNRPGETRHSVYAYDKDGNLTSVTDPLGNITLFEYDATGNQTKITDANGAVTQNTYDAMGRLTTTISGVGGLGGGVKTVNEYDARNNIVKTTQSFADGTDSRVTQYAYDALDRQTLVTDGEGFSTRFSYDPFGNQVKLESGLYLVDANDPAYDAAKAARAQTVSLSFTYDNLDRLVRTDNDENGVVESSYDAFGNRLTQTTRAADGTEVRAVNFVYDDADRLIERTTPAGGLDRFSYDTAGNQIERRTLQSGTGASAVFSVTTFEFDGNGKVTAEVDPLGARTEHVLDAVGNEIETLFAVGAAEERSFQSVFNLNNVLVAEIDPEGHRSDYVVDKVGNRIKETDALGRVTHLYYDELGQHVGTLDPERYFTAFVHDAMGNITQSNVYLNRYTVLEDDLEAPAPATGDPLRRVTTVFDRAGNSISQVGTDGSRQEFVYSSTRKLIRQTNFGNDIADYVARTADSAARVLTFEYDNADRMVKFTNADGVVETYGYDSANNKISETITNPNPLAGSRTDPVRTTRFEYDLDNRLTRQVFDPSGVNLIEQVGYDAASNVVRRVDASGNITTVAYDLGNRQTVLTDALGGKISYGYDLVGNRTSVTDALNNRTDLKYDRNGLVIEELKPQVAVFTIAGGTANVRPRTTTSYDAAGNIIQIVDAAGNKTTRYYDGNDNLVAEINGDNALREYSYNATDDLVTATQYMTRLAPSAHDPLVRPSTPAGESRTVTNEYDSGGRLVRAVYPQVEVTSLSNVGTASPTSTSSMTVLTERNLYDRFGHVVESFDRNGNRTISYYDKRDRVVAAVDAAGFLTEIDFDSQGNVVQQRQYAQALTLANLSSGTKPTAPGTPAAVVDRTFDVANRLVEEVSPAVRTATADLRVTTRFAYDKNGNEVSRTLAAGTADAVTEYSFYDALNRKVGTVDAGRVLVQFGYDANGNNTLVKRYFDPVSAGVNLATATFAAVRADVTADAANDQEKTSTYDALNRQAKQTDLMGPGIADDITVSTQYDAVDNVTARTDQLGNVSKSAHNALGVIVQSITPDNNSTFFEYDTGGLRIRSWTGDLGSIQAVQATGVAASIGDDLRISYNVGATGLRSYVVYDTVRRDRPVDYANQTGDAGSGAVSVGISLESLPPGTTVYFRVVTVDAAGSTAWTEERSVTVPARLTALNVAQVGANIEVTVRFSGSVTNPVLLFGPRGGTLGSTANFVVQADGSYKATLVSPTNPQSLAYQISWTFGGNSYATSGQSFEAPGDHVAVGQTLIWDVPPGAEGTAAANGQFVIVNGVRVDGAFQVNHELQFDPGLTAAGNYVYHVYYGDLAALDHTVDVSFVDRQSTTVLSDVSSGDPQTSRTQVLRWSLAGRDTVVTANLSGTEAATIGSNGLRVAFKAASDTDVFTGDTRMDLVSGSTYRSTLGLSAGSYDLKIYYVDTSGRQVIVEWRRITLPPAAALPADVTVVDNTSPFVFDNQSVSSGGVTDSTFPFNLSRSVTTSSSSFTGKSVTVAATERQGVITRLANGRMTVDPGLYSGGLDPNATSFTLPTATTASAGPNSAKVDGLSAGTYFIETMYNAVGAKIATNEDTGLWRVLGVDGNGNAVRTSTYGTKADQAANRLPIITFTAFDARNLEVAQFGAAVAIDSDGNGTNEAAPVRSVTRSTYDYAGRLASRTDPTPGAAARTFEYDGAGNLIRETNALGQATAYEYDRRGREKRRIDALNHARSRVYDADGRLVREVDGASGTTDYTYDAFDRAIRVTDGLSHSTQFAYDQQDRLVQVTDGNGRVTRYTYDKRGDRTWTQDANNHFFGTAYDSMRRVTHTYSFQGGTPSSLADAIDAVGNTANARHAFLVDEATGYDVFGNKVSETDAMGRRRFFSYGAFGRLQSQTDEGGRVTRFIYDRFGNSSVEMNESSGKNIARSFDAARRLVSVIDSATNVRTTYTYDAGGNRKHETVRAPDFSGTVGVARNVTYTYDGAGQMSLWSDATTGKSLGYTYDAAGNLGRVTGSDGVDHRYTYDAADRLTSITQGASTVLEAYTYDPAGNRRTFSNGTTTVTYTYDAANRVTLAKETAGASSSWVYDAVGNITSYKEAKADNTVIFTQTYTYTENNRTLASATKDERDADADNHSDSKTDNTLDKSGRLLTETLTDIVNDGKTTTFQHSYAADGRELTVTVIGGTSGTSGSSASTYDVNDNLIRLDLGQNDNQDTAEFKRFIYNSDGQILRRFHDDGENDNTNTTTQYLYALGNPVGETGNDTSNNTVTVLDRENYDLVENIGQEFPTPSVTDYQVRLGDTLQSIAGQLYGNPSLWFVIADANGLTGDERLKEGTTLKIPNTVELGRLTAAAHAVYNATDIIGSTLPNLKAPPPDDSAKCAAIGAIIGLILLAIVGVIISIVTIGAAAPAVAAVVGAAWGAAAGVIAGVLIGAAIGAAIAFGVSALSQVILVGAGLQKEFDWTQVLADTAVGFISGGVAGLGELISAGILVGRVAKIATVVASTVLEATGETLRQVIVNPDHRPDNPLSIVLAGVGGAFGSVAAVATRAANLQSARKVAGAVERVSFLDKSLTIGTKFRNTVRKLQDGTKIVRIVQKDGSVLYKQVTRVSAVSKGTPFVSKALDLISKGSDAVPTRTLTKITADIQAVKALSFGQRAQSVLTDAFGKRLGGAVFKVGALIPNAVSALATKVAPYAKSAASAIGRVTGRIGATISGAARSAATVIAGATGRVGTAIGNAGKAVAGALKSAAQTAASAVGRLGRNIGTGLAQLGGVLAKPFKAAARGLALTALGRNAAGQYRAVRLLALGTLLPAVAVGKLGSLVVRGVSKTASVVASAATSVGKVAAKAITKFGSGVATGFQRAGRVVASVANGAAQKAATAVRAIGKRLEPVTRELENVGIVLAGAGRPLGRMVKDIVLGKLDPLVLPLTLIGAGLSGGRVLTRDEGAEGKQRARYFQTEDGLVGPTEVAYGTQGPAGGIGKALFGVLSGELPFRPGYRAATWENNAASTTTSVYSGFQIDRSIDLRSFNALNQIRLGRVAALDRATRDAFASQAIGRVTTNADDVPINLLDPLAPDPSPVMGA